MGQTSGAISLLYSLVQKYLEKRDLQGFVVHGIGIGPIFLDHFCSDFPYSPNEQNIFLLLELIIK